MATEVFKLYPTSAPTTSSHIDGNKAFDRNFDTYARQYSSGSGALLLNNMAGDAFAPLLSQGAVITAVRAKVYLSGNASHSLRFVSDASSTSKYTDCGDGSVPFTASTGGNTVDLPGAMTYIKNNPDKLINNKLGLRLYTQAKDTYIYEAYAELEYELPTTSKVYKGTTKQSVYCGNKKIATYVGTNKIS